MITTKKVLTACLITILFNVIDIYGMDQQPYYQANGQLFYPQNQHSPYNQYFQQPVNQYPSAPLVEPTSQPTHFNISINQQPPTAVVHNTIVYAQPNIFHTLTTECTKHLNAVSAAVNNSAREIQERKASIPYRIFAYLNSKCVSLRKFQEHHATLCKQQNALASAQVTLATLQNASDYEQNLFLQNMFCGIGKPEKTLGQNIKEWGMFSAKCAAFAMVLLWISSMNQIALYMCEGIFFSGCLVILMIYGLQGFSNMLKTKKEGNV